MMFCLIFFSFVLAQSVSNPHDAAGDGFNSAYIEFSTPKEAESAIGQFYFIDGQVLPGTVVYYLANVYCIT